MSESKDCAVCGAMAVYKQGDKNGKRWAGYFCQDQGCKNVEWVQLHETKPVPQPAPQISKPAPKPNGINADMRLAYRKDLMVAIVNTQIADPVTQFNALWSVVENG